MGRQLFSRDDEARFAAEDLATPVSRFRPRYDAATALDMVRRVVAEQLNFVGDTRRGGGEYFEWSADDIKPETSFDGRITGLWELCEIAFAVEDAFDVNISNDEIANIHTVADIMKLLEERGVTNG